MLATNRYHPSFDVLEHRAVPAGNVTGVVQNGNLILTGDAQANAIEIQNDSNDIRILGTGGTTVNGAAFETFSGAFKDVIIKLKGGEDLVHLAGDAVIGRNLLFNGGGGTDNLTSDAGAEIGRDLIFMGGGGISETLLDGVTVGRHVRLSGQGNVLLETTGSTKVNGLLDVQGPAFTGLTLANTVLGRLKVVAGLNAGISLNSVQVGGNVQIKGGSDTDLIQLTNNTRIQGNLTINTRGGNDGVVPDAEVGGNAKILLGGGTNQAVLAAALTVHGGLTIASKGAGTDTWTLQGLDVFGPVKLLSGGGDDTILFNDCHFLSRLTLLAGGGADEVQVSDGNNVHFHGPTLIDLGNGDDTLQLGDGIGSARFRFNVTLQGGNGADTLNDVNSDFDEVPVILGF